MARKSSAVKRVDVENSKFDDSKYGHVLYSVTYEVNEYSIDQAAGFLGGQNPRPVRKAEMNRMLGQTPPDEQVPVEKPVPNITYQVGQQVRVRSGAFANFTGEVEDISNDKQKIWLSVSLFGRPTRVEVDFSEVEPVA